MNSLRRRRWVPVEIAVLKEAAELARLNLQKAKERCRYSNAQYHWMRFVLNSKVLLGGIHARAPERVVEFKVETVSQLLNWDAERQAASIALKDAKLRLEKAIWQYRKAKSRWNDSGNE